MLNLDKVVALIDNYQASKDPKDHTALEHYLRNHSSYAEEKVVRKGRLYMIGNHLDILDHVTVMED